MGIVFASLKIYETSNQYKVSASKYGELEEHYQKENRSLSHINEDYVGWIHMEGVDVDYPVVLGEDNDFYLTHNFYREEDFAGAIFMDYRQSGNKQLDKNTIIYGHNMKNGSMFGNLSQFLDSEFYEKNSFIQLDYLEETYTWEIFAAYETTRTDWLQIDFQNTEEFIHYVEDAKESSVITPTIEVNEEAHVLTLATCTSRNDEERVVIHAKLVEKEV